MKIGRPLAADHRAKIGEALKGNTHTLGKIWDADGRAKLSAERKRRPPTTGLYKGVSLNKVLDKWHAYIKVDGSRRHLGYFPTPEPAARAYDAAAIAAWGTGSCYLNFPQEAAAC